MKEENSIKQFDLYRGFLISVSYRMLGSFSEAEDIVQDVAIEWLRTDTEIIENPKAWLLRVTTNKALDALKRAYKSREVYTGTWLPEVLPDSLITWDDTVQHKESLHTSFLILLENLKPKERAVFILREVVEYSFKEIAEFVGITEANSRKIFERASQKISSKKETFDKYDHNSLDLIRTFFDASCKGDKNIIKELLAPDSEFWSDGGGKVSAVRVVIYEAQKIIRFFINIFSTNNEQSSKFKYEATFVNHLPGLILSRLDEKGLWHIETIFSFELKNGIISKIYAQRDPDKLSLGIF